MERFKCSLQPTPIIIGDNLDNIIVSYVSVNDILHQVQTPLKAFELCFKIIHALQACYAVEAEHVWLLIQKGLFELTTKYDKKFVSVTQLLQDIKAVN